MRALALVVLASCNQVYDLEATTVRDARFFDAPETCPGVGAPLEFSPLLEQLLYDCTNYTATSERAIALCREGLQYQPYGGPPEGPFTPIPELPRTDATTTIFRPLLSTEGVLLLRSRVNMTGEQRLMTFRLENGVWTRGVDIMNVDTNTGVSSGRLIGYKFPEPALRELSNASGGFAEVRQHPLAALGITSLSTMWLTSDALHLIIMATVEGIPEAVMRYTDRASVDDAFGPVRPFDVPVAGDGFITENCNRYYFSALRTIFYARRR